MSIKRNGRRNVFNVILLVSVMFWILCSINALAETIIDNGDPGTSYTGTWSVSGGEEPWDPADSSATSLWSRNGDTYTWTFTPTDSGYHEFSMWWTAYSSRSDNVPVIINYWGGTDTVTINQQTDGGIWNTIDSFPFEAGVSYDITVTAVPGGTQNYSTCADAVQLVYLPGNVLPVATIESISPNPALTGAPVTFTGHGDDIDGEITGYRWHSSINGNFGDSAASTTSSSLSPGIHIITFTVVDDDLEESEPVTRTLTVQDTINEVIIDNGDSETSFTGTWGVSGADNPWNPADPASTSLWSRNGDTYTWTFTPSISGTYGFSMWWTQYVSRSSNIPVTIEYSGGTDNATINQQTNGGKWNMIGSYPFIAGENYNITITAVPGGTQNYSTCADAVRFVYSGNMNQLPVATIDDINPKVAVPGSEITFRGSGVDNDGTVVYYELRSDIDGILSSGIPTDPDTITFSTDLLHQGTHTISFRVQDNEGVWSKYAVALVVVRDCDSPVAIMPLGDSITYGVGEISADDLITGYRQPLFQSLKSAGYYIDFVGDRTTGLLVIPPFDINHQGVPGIADSTVADSVYDWLVANPAEIVLLHIGTNDFSTDASDVENILDEIDRYETDQGKEITVVLARIINRTPYHPDTTVFNNNVQAMAEARIAAGDKIVIVDQESALNYSTDMWNTLHPNSIGYNKMAEVWMTALADLLPVCSDFGPFIFTTPIIKETVGYPYTYNVRALGNPTPSYSLLAGVPGMSINSDTGEISWTPASGQVGFHEITVQAENTWGTITQDFSINVSEGIIIDNGDPETSFTGTWSVSGATDPWNPADPSRTSLWSRNGDTYTWTFIPSISGTYEFSMWWTQYVSRSSNIPVTIEYSGGTVDATINQQTNGGKWNIIGSYPFIAGENYNITITAVPGGTQNYSTCADAIRFVFQSTTTTHTITATSGSNGTITPSGTVTVNDGDDQAFDISPATGYHVADVLVDSSSVGAVTSYTFPNVTANHTISASFVVNAGTTHTITATSGSNGTITPSGTVTVNDGDDQAFDISPATGYHVADVLVDSSSVGAVTSYTFPNVTANHTISASFVVNAGTTHTITATSGSNGIITPSGTVTVNDGDDQAFDISPATGYHVADVLVDSSSVGAVTSYTFPNVTANHTISASFVSDDSGSVIIDNGDIGTSFTGTWAASSASGWFDTEALWSRDGSIYRWTFSPSVSGYYDVAMWWTVWPSRSTHVPVTIEHASGSTVVNINQQLNGSQWNSLGAFNFNAGSSYRISITAQPGPSSTCADAVRMTSAPPPPPTEQIFVFPGYASLNALPDLTALLRDLGAVEDNGVWQYRNAAQNKNFEIRLGNSIEGMRQALMTENAHVLYFGHSNYGLGGMFATNSEFQNQVISDIKYIDDDRIFNYSSKWVHVSIPGMRTGQAYPFWWPIFKDGSSGIMPYEFNDPKADPAYNYYMTYQVSGDPTHYKIENVQHGAIERFPDWGGPAWYSPDGSVPDPSNPDDQQYFITNPTPWEPSVEVVGDWPESQTYPGYYLENYRYSSAGVGNNQMGWMFDIPTSGNYIIKAWWAASQTRSNNAPFTVYHSNSTTHAADSTTIRVNQRFNGGQWNELGEFFFDAGKYSVVLTNDTTTGNVVGDAIRVEHEDNPPEVLSADFYARVRSGVAPLEVTFDTGIVGQMSGLSWDFGDGNTNSTRDYITHIYDQPGIYTVRFTVYGPLGSYTVTKNDYIVVGADSDPDPVLRAEFSARSSQEGLVPFEARFRDRSSGSIVSWEWNFGDGITSGEESPTHIYETPGNYTVTLKVTDSDGSTSVETKSNFMRADIFNKTVDNVDYPKTHYRSKTILFLKELDIDPNDFKYSRLLYVGCDSGHYFTDTFKRGIMFYALNTSSTADMPILTYLRSYLEGKSDYEIWQDLQSVDPIFDYYYFDKTPSEQPVD